MNKFGNYILDYREGIKYHWDMENTFKQLPAHVRDAGDYTNWVYPDAGLLRVYAQSFPSCQDAMHAACQVIGRNGAMKINIVHSPSGSVLHTWDQGSWRYSA